MLRLLSMLLPGFFLFFFLFFFGLWGFFLLFFFLFCFFFFKQEVLGFRSIQYCIFLSPKSLFFKHYRDVRPHCTVCFLSYTVFYIPAEKIYTNIVFCKKKINHKKKLFCKIDYKIWYLR